MPNTYTQVHLHAVFAVKFRAALIDRNWKERLHQYVTGIVQLQGHKMICINSMPDHLLMLFGLRPAQSISDLMRIVKADSSAWINKERLVRSLFRWQDGYGAFSFSRSQIGAVADYIGNQELHHRKKSFREEYVEMLRAAEVAYDGAYVFTELE